MKVHSWGNIMLLAWLFPWFAKDPTIEQTQRTELRRQRPERRSEAHLEMEMEVR